VSSDEHQILEFLKTSKEFFSVREVARRVGGKKRCQKEPLWAKPPLIHLANSGHIQMNEMGHFRFLPEEEKKKKNKEKLHVSPQIAEILARSGKPHLAAVHEIESDAE